MILSTVSLISTIYFLIVSFSIFLNVYNKCLFCFLASSSVLYNEISASFNEVIFLRKTSSPAAKAALPMAMEGRIGTDKAKYGIAKKALPTTADKTSFVFMFFTL